MGHASSLSPNPAFATHPPPTGSNVGLAWISLDSAHILPVRLRFLRNWGAHPPRVLRRTPSFAAASAPARAVRRRLSAFCFRNFCFGLAAYVKDQIPPAACPP